MCETPEPQGSRREQEVFDDLRALTQRRGFVHALAYIAVMDQAIFYGDALSANNLQSQFDPQRLIATEIAVLSGLWAQTERDVALVDSDALSELVWAAYTLMEEMHAVLSAPIRDRVRPMSDGTVVDQLDKGAFFREVIFYGPLSAFPFQFRDCALARYAQDEEWLRRNKGFDMVQACGIAEAIAHLTNRQLTDLRRRLVDSRPQWFSPFEAVCVTTIDIATVAGVDEQVVTSFFAAFGLTARNAAFRAIDDYNEAKSFPLMALGSGTFFVPDVNALYQALYESPIFWMRADPTYAEAANEHRGAFTEAFARDCLVRSFGRARVFTNVMFKQGERVLGEVDVLAVLGDRCMIVQCKAKGLTIAARKGNEAALDRDFQGAIADAYQQAVDCGRLLLAAAADATLADGSPMVLGQRPHVVFPACVVADYYPALSSQVRAFLTSDNVESIREPFVMDVFSLDVLTEFLSTPLRLLSYVDQHAKVIDRVVVLHELTCLAYHLRHNLWVDPSTGLYLDDSISAHLDAAMMVRRMGLPGARTPEGILTDFVDTPYERLVAQLEEKELSVTVDLGLMLLQMDPRTIHEINEALRRLFKMTQRRGGQHDFSIHLGRSGAGLTVHVNDRSGSEARDRLIAHSELKKHQQRSNEWYAVLLDPEGWLRFAAVTRTPYQASDEGDQLANTMLPPMTPVRTVRDVLTNRPAKRAKLGVNDPCFCGSGKKYKRCHLFATRP